LRKLSIIGIGAGDPEQVTVQAINALNAADVFFVVVKSCEQDDLVALRREVLDRYLERAEPRVVEIQDPKRARGATREEQRAIVAEWRAKRATQYAQLFDDELGDDGAGAFLAWGDPTLYESTLSVLKGIDALEIEVIPGISAVSALAARHGIPLNRVGGAIQITTGRRLAEEGLPDGADDVVVMLDPECRFRDHPGVDVYWGAYLGTPDEILVSGPVAEVADEIVARRAEAKERKGWVFDTYLLRKPR
jgi:precorrin-6A synthase